jgi:hypothetical protein
MALSAIGLRAFVFHGQVHWEVLLWALQGIAMVVAWLFSGAVRRPRYEQGVDMKAKRLHW